MEASSPRTTGGGKMALVMVLLLVACDGVRGSARRGRRPWYVRCQKGGDCGPGKCCAVLVGRYMVPMCLPMKRRLGDECSARSVNVTARYPKAAVVSLTDVHLESCPCHGHLACKEGFCRLKDIDTNSLPEE